MKDNEICSSQSQDPPQEAVVFFEKSTELTHSLINISNLPDEILLEIFKTLYDLCDFRADWFQINLVCRHWRYIVVEAPSFWNKVPFWRPHLTPLMLERSKMSDLHVELDGYLSADIVTAIFAHIGRIRSLSIKQDSPRLEQYDAALHILGKEADRLEELVIECTGQETPHSTLSCFDVLPLDRLRRATISNIPLDWTTLHLPNLTHLDLEYIQWSEEIPLVQLIDTLRHMSRLEELRLPFNMLSHGPVTDCLPAHLPRLGSLNISFASPNEVEYFLSHTSLPRLYELSIGCEGAIPHPEADYTSLMRSISSTVTKGDFPVLDGLHIMNNLIMFEEKEQNLAPHRGLDLSLPHHNDTESIFSVTKQVATGLAAHPLSHLVRLDASSEITPAAFLQLFSGLPLLESISVRGDQLVNTLIQGLKIEPSQVVLDDKAVFFPALKEITLHSASISSRMVKELHSHLSSRYPYAERRICKLNLRNCHMTCDIDTLKECVDEVVIRIAPRFQFE